MKKILFVFALLGFSLNSFAVSLPVIFNSDKCAAFANGNLTSCFQNKTDRFLSEYQLKETLLFDNGETIESISNLGGMQPDFFTVISFSSPELQKRKITLATFSIIKGDAMTYKVVAGCNTEFSANSVSKSILSIYEKNGNLYCK